MVNSNIDINDLEADGMISIYKLDTFEVVASYEGLEIYEMLEDYKRVLEKLKRFESSYFICPDCEYKVSPNEFLTGGKKYDEDLENEDE